MGNDNFPPRGQARFESLNIGPVGVVALEHDVGCSFVRPSVNPWRPIPCESGPDRDAHDEVELIRWRGLNGDLFEPVEPGTDVHTLFALYDESAFEFLESAFQFGGFHQSHPQFE